MIFIYDEIIDVIHYFITATFKEFFFVIVIDLILSKFSDKISSLLKIVVITISVMMFILDIFCLYQYHSVINHGMFEILLATNSSESAEFIETYILTPQVLLSFIIIPIIGVILYKLLLHLMDFNTLTSLIFAATLFVAAISMTTSIPLLLKNFSSLNRIIYMSNNLFESYFEYQRIAEGVVRDVNLTRDDSNIPIFVFILGESTNRNHMHIYGYNLPDTPNLEERKDNGELFVFTDVVSPHSHTISALENIFTFYRVGADGDWFNYTNLFDILRAANYHTEWISNQEMAGVYGNIGRLYSEICDVKKFTKIRASNDDIGYSDIYYDRLLFPLFDESLANISTKNFYVLHLMGTHASYNKRYPNNYLRFTESDVTGETDEIRWIRSEYDNAVLYNDYIVDELIKRLENKNAIVIYISDHGEDVYDEWNFAGHMEVEGTRSMIEIPMMIWASSQFKAEHPALIKRIAESVDKPFMTDDMIHVILDIMQIETKEYDPTKSVINPAFDESRERIYNNNIYDKEHGLTPLPIPIEEP